MLFVFSCKSSLYSFLHAHNYLVTFDLHVLQKNWNYCHNLYEEPEPDPDFKTIQMQVISSKCKYSTPESSVKCIWFKLKCTWFKLKCIWFKLKCIWFKLNAFDNIYSAHLDFSCYFCPKVIIMTHRTYKLGVKCKSLYRVIYASCMCAHSGAECNSHLIWIKYIWIKCMNNCISIKCKCGHSLIKSDYKCR